MWVGEGWARHSGARRNAGSRGKNEKKKDKQVNNLNRMHVCTTWVRFLQITNLTNFKTYMCVYPGVQFILHFYDLHVHERAL